jgi:nucleotide-binding universal stress UspA family protein
MKTILVINDRTAEAHNAVEFAFDMARKTGAGILLWNTFKQATVKKRSAAMAMYKGTAHEQVELVKPALTITHTGNLLIEHVHTYGFSASYIAEIVVKKNIWMVVKGAKHAGNDQSVFEDDNTQDILNKISCPLLLIPEKLTARGFNKMVYTADLRYCRLEVIRHITHLANPYNAEVLVAHIAAKGLPDIGVKYAQQIFADEISANVNYENLYFNHISEKNISKAVDVLTDVMHTDLLVLVNHKFHFEEIVGRKLSGRLPDYLHIPLLVFPS